MAHQAIAEDLEFLQELDLPFPFCLAEQLANEIQSSDDVVLRAERHRPLFLSKVSGGIAHSVEHLAQFDKFLCSRLGHCHWVRWAGTKPSPVIQRAPAAAMTAPSPHVPKLCSVARVQVVRSIGGLSGTANGLSSPDPVPVAAP